MAKPSNFLLSGNKIDRACVTNMKEDRMLVGKIQEMQRVNNKNLSKIYNDKMDIRWLYNKMQSTTEALFYDRNLFVKDVKISPSKKIISSSDSLTLLKKRTDHLKEKYHSEQLKSALNEDQVFETDRDRTFTDPGQSGHDRRPLPQALPRIVLSEQRSRSNSGGLGQRARSNTDGSSPVLKARSALLRKRTNTQLLNASISTNIPKPPNKEPSVDELFEMKLKELNDNSIDQKSILLSQNYHMRSRAHSHSDRKRRSRATTVADPVSVSDSEGLRKAAETKQTDFPPLKPRPRAFTTALSAEF